MLRQDLSSIDPRANGSGDSTRDSASASAFDESGPINLQQELNKIEEIILASPRVPFTRRTLVDEDQLLDQLDLVRLSLPSAIREATQIVQHQDRIVAQAEQYAQDIVAAAEAQAAQILDELGIVRQAEREAHQVRLQAQQECDALKGQAIAEIDQLQLQAQQQLESLREEVLSDCQAIRQDADGYADQVLRQMESQFSDMLRVIRNGRQQLQSPGASKSAPAPKRNFESTASTPRPATPGRPDRPKR